MPIYTYSPKAVRHPETGAALEYGAGQVFSPTDTNFSAPLVISDLNGNPMDEVIVYSGATVDFRVEDRSSVVWRDASGSYTASLDADGGNLPPGGAPGEVLVKASGADYEVEWAAAPQIGDVESITSASITDATTVGRAVLTAASTTAARSAIGAGTSNLVVGTTATTAKAGNYVPSWTEVTSKPIITVGEYANIQAAVAASAANGTTINLTGTVTAVGNIPGFWDATFEGPGAVMRGSDIFRVQPRPTAGVVPTNNIYVNASTGNDSNDGLTPDFALKTLAGVYNNVLRRLTAEQAAGAHWVVNLSGTFTSGVTMTELPAFAHDLDFRGQPLVSGAPVTTISKGTGPNRIGLWIEPGVPTVNLYNLRFSGFNEVAAYGFLMKRGGVVYAYDCTADNCTVGFAAIQGVQFVFTRCKADATNAEGFWGQYNSCGTFSLCEATGSTGNGISVSRNTIVHVDDCTLTSCNKGVFVDMASRANVLRSNFKRNSVGVEIAGAAEWINSTGNNFNVGTADANVIDYQHTGTGRETRIYSDTARNEFLVGGSFFSTAYTPPQTVTASASGTATVYSGSALGTLPANFFTSTPKKMRVKVFGQFNSRGGAARVALWTLKRDGTDLQELNRCIIPGADLTAFVCEFEVWATGPASQQGFSHYKSHATTGTRANPTTIDMSSERWLRVVYTASTGSDDVTFLGMETYLMG